MSRNIGLLFNSTSYSLGFFCPEVLGTTFSFTDSWSPISRATRLLVNGRGWILSAWKGKDIIHPCLSTRSKNSERRGAACNVLRDPKIINFERARVNETFILRQSFTNSPIYNTITKLEFRSRLTLICSYLSVLIASHHTDNHAILVPALAAINGQDLYLGTVL
jgi:hypothetical protein